MKRLAIIAILTLAACDDGDQRPRERVEQILPARPAPKPIKLTLRNVPHMTHTPIDATTPQQIASAATELLREQENAR